jgi:hypothetical protein
MELKHRLEEVKMNEGYIELANAIIEQAAKDYIEALKILSVKPNDKKASYTKVEIEKFFRSQWFIQLTDVDGEKLLAALKFKFKKERTSL